jgi:benzodiazapine receptor
MAGIASKSQLRMSFLRYALFTVPAILLLGSLAGALSGANAANPWFAALHKPGTMPPAWLFPAAWPLLHVLLGLALAVVLHAHGAKRRRRALILFGLQLLLTLAWPPAFFGFHRLGPALSIAAAMFVCAFVLILAVWRIRPLAGLLLYPCLAWAMYLAMLNFQILGLNPDASTLAPPGASTDIRL